MCSQKISSISKLSIYFSFNLSSTTWQILHISFNFSLVKLLISVISSIFDISISSFFILSIYEITKSTKEGLSITLEKRVNIPLFSFIICFIYILLVSSVIYSLFNFTLSKVLSIYLDNVVMYVLTIPLLPVYFMYASSAVILA